jgi:hypothetical protein
MNGLNDWDFGKLMGRQNRQFNQALGWGQQREAKGLSNLETLSSRAGMPLGRGYGALLGGGQLGGTKQLLRLAQAQQMLVPDASSVGGSGGMNIRTPEQREMDRLALDRARNEDAMARWRNTIAVNDYNKTQRGGFSFGPLDPREQLERNQATMANRNLFNAPQGPVNNIDWLEQMRRNNEGARLRDSTERLGIARQREAQDRNLAMRSQQTQLAMQDLGLKAAQRRFGWEQNDRLPNADPYAGIMKRAQVGILNAQARQESAKASAMDLAAKPQSSRPTGSLGSMNPVAEEQNRDALNRARANTALQNAPQYIPSALPNFQSASPGSARDGLIQAGQEFRAITDQGAPLPGQASGVNRTMGTNGVPGYSQTGVGGGTTNALVPGSPAWHKIKGTNSGGSAPGASAGKK